MSPARSAPGRGRAKNGPGRIQWIALFTAGTVVMGLTFTLGLLVGRQWSQWSHPASAAAVADGGARKTVPPGKRGGLSAADVEPSPSVDQKLTFYRTLTAPLGRGSADASQRHEAKAQPAPESVRAEPAPPPYPYASRGETLVEKPAAPEAEAVPARAPADAAGFWSGLWSVQVAAFKTQGQAALLHRQLREAGFDAYIVPAVVSDGQTNYRVRVGTFKGKAEAQRMVERLRGERSLAAFVTPR